jgi:hypothetical protein
VAGGCGQGAAAQFAHHQGCDVEPGGAGESKAPVAWSAVAAIEQAALDLVPTDWDAALDAVDRALYAIAWALATRGALPTALPPQGFDERLAAIFA